MKMNYSNLILLTAFVFMSGCSKNKNKPEWLPAYLESELLEIASPEAGYLKVLSVNRGQLVKEGDALFELDDTALEFDRESAAALAEASAARLADAREGLRPDEIAVLVAEMEEASAALKLATKELERTRKLFTGGASTQAQLDQAESVFTQAKEAVHLLEARLRLAHEGSRTFQQKALADELYSAESKAALADWYASQSKQNAPVAAFVQDTLYQKGEWVPASNPVVLLRPADLLRVRFFLSSRQLAGFHLNDTVEVLLSGRDDPITAIVERVSDSPEYTPPVIFSSEQSAKLVFLVEARLSQEWARKLHPGQPVLVRLKNTFASPDPY